MDNFSLNQLSDPKYSWLINSDFFNSLKKDEEFEYLLNEEFFDTYSSEDLENEDLENEDLKNFLNENLTIIYCSKYEMNIDILLNVINFWGVKCLPFEIYDKIRNEPIKNKINELFNGTHDNFYQYLLDFSSFPVEDLLNLTIKNNQLDGLKYCIKKFDEIILNIPENIVFSAKCNSLEIIKYLHKNGAKLTVQISEFLSLNGNLDGIIYLYNNKCEFNNKCFANAALGGYIECIKYLHNNGFEWDKETCRNAAYKNYFNIVKYVYENGGEVPFIYIDLAKYGNLEGLKYAFENKFPANTIYDENYDPDNFSPFVCEEAASAGSLSCLIFLHEHNFKWDYNTLINSAKNGDIESLKYAIENGCSIIDENGDEQDILRDITRILEGMGRISLKIAYKNSKKINECIIYLHKIGCIWTKKTTENVAFNNNLELLIYVFENKLKIPEYKRLKKDEENILDRTAYFNGIECIDYLYSVQKYRFTFNGLFLAIEGGNFEKLKYICELKETKEDKIFSKNACILAIKEEKNDFLIYMINSGCEFYQECLTTSINKGNIKIITFLLDYFRENNIFFYRNLSNIELSEKNKNIEIFKLLLLNDFIFDIKFCTLVAEKGYLEILTFLYKNGIYGDNNTCINTAENGHRLCFNFLINNKYYITECDIKKCEELLDDFEDPIKQMIKRNKTRRINKIS